jgi:hypothetical protein
MGILPPDIRIYYEIKQLTHYRTNIKKCDQNTSAECKLTQISEINLTIFFFFRSWGWNLEPVQAKHVLYHYLIPPVHKFCFYLTKFKESDSEEFTKYVQNIFRVLE